MGHVARMEECTSAFKILTSKPTGRKSLGRPRDRWKDNIRIYLKETAVNTRNCMIRLRMIIGEPL